MQHQATLGNFWKPAPKKTPKFSRCFPSQTIRMAALVSRHASADDFLEYEKSPSFEELLGTREKHFDFYLNFQAASADTFAFAPAPVL